MLTKSLFILLGAALVFLGSMLSKPNASTGTDVQFDRIYCREIVLYRDYQDLSGEFKGIMLTSNSLKIHHPNHGKAIYTYNGLYFVHPETGQEIKIDFSKGLETKGIK